MKFIYLNNGAIYCWWGKQVKPSIAPLSSVESMLKGGKVIDVKEEWFLVFDPAIPKDRWFP